MTYVKKSLLALAVIAAASLTAITAQASLLIEPHLGYILPTEETYGGEKNEYNGPQFGARIGYQTLGFMAGLDYTRSSYTLDVTDEGVKTSFDKTRNNLGAFVGYNFPILLRAWIGYDFSVKESQDGNQSGATDGDYMKGNATVLGVGFTGLPFLSINLTYRMLKYDEYKDGAETGAINPNFEPKEIALEVSLPLNL